MHYTKNILQVYIIKVAKFFSSSQIRRTPKKSQNWFLSLQAIIIRSALKCMIRRVVNHLCIIIPTLDTTIYSL